MSRAKILRTRLLAILLCFWLIVDLFCNLALSFVTMVWAVLTGQEGAPPSAFETMSARAGRGMVNGRLLSRIFGFIVDRVFAIFQKPVIELPDGRTFKHSSHCIRATIKTRHGTYLPREYHEPLPADLLAGYQNSIDA